MSAMKTTTFAMGVAALAVTALGLGGAFLLFGGSPAEDDEINADPDASQAAPTARSEEPPEVRAPLPAKRSRAAAPATGAKKPAAAGGTKKSRSKAGAGKRAPAKSSNGSNAQKDMELTDYMDLIGGPWGEPVRMRPDDDDDDVSSYSGSGSDDDDQSFQSGDDDVSRSSDGSDNGEDMDFEPM